jgi:hypothetical protein
MLPGIVGSAQAMFDGSQRWRVMLDGSANVELTWLMQP